MKILVTGKRATGKSVIAEQLAGREIATLIDNLPSIKTCLYNHDCDAYALYTSLNNLLDNLDRAVVVAETPYDFPDDTLKRFDRVGYARHIRGNEFRLYSWSVENGVALTWPPPIVNAEYVEEFTGHWRPAPQEAA